MARSGGALRTRTVGPEAEGTPRPPADDADAIRLGTYRDLWAAEAAERSPALRFLVPAQTLEVAPADAERLGVRQGDEVDVRSNGTSVRARVAVRERMRDGAGFMLEGLAENSANALVGVERVEVKQVKEAAP